MIADKLRQLCGQFQHHVRRFAWGGSWAATLPAKNRWNLTLFFYDGLFAAASDKIILTYLTIYLLALGATSQQIGLLSSLSNFFAAFLLLPAALLVERTGKRQKITLNSAAGSRLAILLMALLPFIMGASRAMIWVILGLALLREAFNNIGYPGWMALTGDIVPLEGRGRYFGSRNFIMGVAGIITALSVGEAITRIGEPLGYQIAFILAVVFGLISMSFFARIQDPEKETETIDEVQTSLRIIIASLKGQTQFILFCLFTAIWNFSINIAGPFFNVFMVDTLNFTAAMIGVTTVANTIASLAVQRQAGSLADRWGDRKTSIVFLLVIPFLPLLWGIWVQEYWQAVLLHVLGGLFWGAYNLVSFNILLMQTPEKLRARFSALYQIVVTLSLAGGAALGSFLIPKIDFSGVALTSAGGRWIAGVFFLLFVGRERGRRKSKKSSEDGEQKQ
jgi:MFS family permease